MYLRRATIPLISGERYDRRWFLVSLAAAPPAVALFLGSPPPVAALMGLMGSGAAMIAGAATRGNPEEPPTCGCGLRVPLGALCVALVGFAVACCWINAIATELLALLQFFGILCHVSDMV